MYGVREFSGDPQPAAVGDPRRRRTQRRARGRRRRAQAARRVMTVTLSAITPGRRRARGALAGRVRRPPSSTRSCILVGPRDIRMTESLGNDQPPSRGLARARPDGGRRWPAGCSTPASRSPSGTARRRRPTALVARGSDTDRPDRGRRLWSDLDLPRWCSTTPRSSDPRGALAGSAGRLRRRATRAWIDGSTARPSAVAAGRPLAAHPRWPRLRLGAGERQPGRRRVGPGPSSPCPGTTASVVCGRAGAGGARAGRRIASDRGRQANVVKLRDELRCSPSPCKPLAEGGRARRDRAGVARSRPPRVRQRQRRSGRRSARTRPLRWSGSTSPRPSPPRGSGRTSGSRSAPRQDLEVPMPVLAATEVAFAPSDRQRARRRAGPRLGACCRVARDAGIELTAVGTTDRQTRIIPPSIATICPVM